MVNEKDSVSTIRGGSSSAAHYETHSKAETYDQAYFYEPGAYMEHLVQLVLERLQLKQQQQESGEEENSKNAIPRCLLDIGGGTGTFANALLKKDNTAKFRAVVVEPFLDQANNAGVSEPHALSFVKASAEEFLVPPNTDGDDWRTQIAEQNHGGYDHILLKEVVHHLKASDRVGIFRGMKEGFRTNDGNARHPSLLIITRPQTDIDYPLWDGARAVWKDNQPSLEELEDDLRSAGYTTIESTVESYPCSISLNRWQTMVQNRFWSTFSKFSDQELAEACEVIAKQARKDPRNHTEQEEGMVLEFEDRLIFLTAS